TLPYDPEPALAEVFSEVAALRDQLLKWGFREEHCDPEPARPAGLLGIERELFRDDAHRRKPLECAGGLTMLGAPQGGGLGLGLARRVRELLDRRSDPEDILVLFPRWDEHAALAFETLGSWGLPVSAEPARPLAAEPSVSALVLAMNLPVDGWETSRLISLLRNSLARPDWPALRSDPQPLAAPATALRESRVFRGPDALRAALLRGAAANEKTSAGVEKPTPRALRARAAVPILDRLANLL